MNIRISSREYGENRIVSCIRYWTACITASLYRISLYTFKVIFEWAQCLTCPQHDRARLYETFQSTDAWLILTRRCARLIHLSVPSAIETHGSRFCPTKIAQCYPNDRGLICSKGKFNEPCATVGQVREERERILYGIGVVRSSELMLHDPRRYIIATPPRP